MHARHPAERGHLDGVSQVLMPREMSSLNSEQFHTRSTLVKHPPAPDRPDVAARVLPGRRTVLRAVSTPGEGKTCASRQRLCLGRTGGTMR
jgi:hypothetical protein